MKIESNYLVQNVGIIILVQFTLPRIFLLGATCLVLVRTAVGIIFIATAGILLAAAS